MGVKSERVLSTSFATLRACCSADDEGGEAGSSSGDMIPGRDRDLLIPGGTLKGSRAMEYAQLCIASLTALYDVDLRDDFAGTKKRPFMSVTRGGGVEKEALPVSLMLRGECSALARSGSSVEIAI